jgi:hypothetical protein
MKAASSIHGGFFPEAAISWLALIAAIVNIVICAEFLNISKLF